MTPWPLYKAHTARHQSPRYSVIQELVMAKSCIGAFESLTTNPSRPPSRATERSMNLD